MIDLADAAEMAPLSSPVVSVPEGGFEPDLDVVRLFISSKAKIIQRWWRRILAERRNIHPFIAEYEEASSHFMGKEDSGDSMKVALPRESQEPDISPIKLADELYDAKSDPALTLRMRRDAA